MFNPKTFIPSSRMPSASAILESKGIALKEKTNHHWSYNPEISEEIKKKRQREMVREVREELAEKQDNKLFPKEKPRFIGMKVTRVKCVKKGIYSLSGLGRVMAANVKDAVIKSKAKENGYSHMRVGIVIKAI